MDETETLPTTVNLLQHKLAIEGASSGSSLTTREASAKTTKACACKNTCGNPDNDVGGEWCYVADENCQKTNWGYCATLLMKTDAVIKDISKHKQARKEKKMKTMAEDEDEGQKRR